MAIRPHLMVFLALLVPATITFAEDFSVHLDNMAVIDATRPVPQYKLVKEFNAAESKGESEPNLPYKVYDVYLDFGTQRIVKLGQREEAGPSRTDLFGKVGNGFACDLDDQSIKASWLKNARDLLRVGWVDEPNPQGSALTFYSSYVLLRVGRKKVDVLARGCTPMNMRTSAMSYDFALESHHFEFDAKTNVLLKRITRSTEITLTEPAAMHHLGKNENGDKIWKAVVEEKVTLKYRFKNVAPELVEATLSYQSQKGDNSKDISKFYLGPLAPVDSVLKANPDAKIHGKERTAWSELDEGQWLTIPVSKDWLHQRYGLGVN